MLPHPSQYYTGLYPVKSGAYPNHTFAKAGTHSIVHYLQPLGYRVALSGKTHISPKEIFPFEYSGKDSNPENAPVIQELQIQLDAWMRAQGDQGAQTEMEALEHQGRNRNKNEDKKRGRKKTAKA